MSFVKTPNNEVSRNELSYKERIEFFEKRAKEFFESYENPTGSEDRLEVCLIRDGRRAVAKAKEEINRLNAEIDRLRKEKEQIEVKGSETIHVLCAEIKTLKKTNDAYTRECNRIVRLLSKAKKEAVEEFMKLFKANAFEFYEGDFAYKITETKLKDIERKVVGDDVEGES